MFTHKMYSYITAKYVKVLHLYKKKCYAFFAKLLFDRFFFLTVVNIYGIEVVNYLNARYS